MAASKLMLTSLNTNQSSRHVLGLATYQLTEAPHPIAAIFDVNGKKRIVWMSEDDYYSGKWGEQKAILVDGGDNDEYITQLSTGYLQTTPVNMLPMINRIQFLYRRNTFRQFKRFIAFSLTMAKINKRGAECMRVNKVQIRRKILRFI